MMPSTMASVVRKIWSWSMIGAVMISPAIGFATSSGHASSRICAAFSASSWEPYSRLVSAVVMVTHDPDIAARADRGVELRDGRLQPVSRPA